LAEPYEEEDYASTHFYKIKTGCQRNTFTTTRRERGHLAASSYQEKSRRRADAVRDPGLSDNKRLAKNTERRERGGE